MQGDQPRVLTEHILLTLSNIRRTANLTSFFGSCALAVARAAGVFSGPGWTLFPESFFDNGVRTLCFILNGVLTLPFGAPDSRTHLPPEMLQ